MKRIFIILTAILSALCLAACAGAKPEPNGDQSEASAVPNATEPSPTEQAPDETEPAPTEAAAVELISGFERIGSLNAVCAAGGSHAVIHYGALTDEPDPEDRMYQQHLAVIDAESGTVTAETVLCNGFGETLLGARKNGDILTADVYGGELYVYGPDLVLKDTVTLPEECVGSELTLESGSGRVFCVAGSVIYEVTGEGSLGTAAEFDEGVSVKAFDPARGLVLCERPNASAVFGREIVLYSTENEAPLMAEQTAASAFILHEGQAAALSVRPMPAADGASVEDNTIVTLYKNNAPFAALGLGGGYSIEWQDGSDYAFGTEHVSDGFAHAAFFDFDEGSSASLELSGRLTDIRRCRIGETGRCLVAAVSEAEGDTGFADMGVIRLYAVDPSRLDYTSQLASAEPDCERTIRAQLDENRAVLRSIADGVEAEFGVEVLLGDDCSAAEHPEKYRIHSTDAAGRDVSSSVSAMLGSLTEQLSVYPEGFFRHFTSPDGQGGMRILIADRIENVYDDLFPTVGVFYRIGQWYYMSVDATGNGDVTAVFHHELWHATEARIWEEKPSAFDYDTWMRLNPEGFDNYIYDIDENPEEGERWIPYIFTSGDEPYFIRNYSLTDPYEDRATLVEALFNGSFAGDLVSSAQALREYPHLKAKLDFMAEQVKEIFGAVCWERG